MAITTHPVAVLFERMALVEPYAEQMCAVPARIEGTTFFPGGWGLWCARPGAEPPPMPVGGVMVVGQDFYNLDGYKRLQANGQERSNTTWGALGPMLTKAGIPLAKCFFTNFVIGLRTTATPDGCSPAWADSSFIRRCGEFFRHQLLAQRPKLVLSLGFKVPPALGQLSPELSIWARAGTIAKLDEAGGLVRSAGFRLPDGTFHCATVAAITHPCRRSTNVVRRRYGALRGEAAESAMLAEALVDSGLSSN